MKGHQKIAMIYVMQGSIVTGDVVASCSLSRMILRNSGTCV